MQFRLFALAGFIGLSVSSPADAQSAKDIERATAQCKAYGYTVDTLLAECVEGELAAIKIEKRQKRNRFWSIVAAGLGGAAEGANNSQTSSGSGAVRSFGSRSTGPTMCPDGTYVGGARCEMTPRGRYVGGTPTMAPDGTYVAGQPQMTPRGTYVGSGPITMCPDGSYVSGANCKMAPNGRYVGQ